MKRAIVLSIFLAFLFLGRSFADTTIKAEVNKLKLSTDDILIYKLSIVTTEKNLAAPILPGFEGFNVLSQAESSNMSFEKNQIKTVLIYEFILAPTAAGKFKIAATSIKAPKGILSTDAFEIEVTQGKVNLPTPREQAPTPSKPGQPESEEPQITL